MVINNIFLTKPGEHKFSVTKLVRIQLLGSIVLATTRGGPAGAGLAGAAGTWSGAGIINITPDNSDTATEHHGKLRWGDFNWII